MFDSLFYLSSKTHLLSWVQQRKNWNNFMLSMLLELLSLNWKFVAGFLCWIIKKANKINCFRKLFFEKSLCQMEGNHVWIAFLIVPILSKNKLFRMKKLSRFWVAVLADCWMTCFCSTPTPRKLASNHIAKANKFYDHF